MKKITVTLLCLLIALTMFGCGKQDSNTDSTENNNDNKTNVVEKNEVLIVEDLDSFEEQIDYLIDCGDQFKEVYADRQAVYFYSIAAANVTSLRYMADNILWLKGEGETISDLSKERYADWYEIAALNYTSPFPLYCQYLLLKMQAKEEASTLLAQAQKNPDCPTDDLFYNWKEKSVEELYELKADLEKIEDKIFALYQPNVTPLEVLCGDEYSIEFHVLLTQMCLESNETEVALQCAERAINVNPFTGRGYAFGALAAMSGNNMQLALDYLNEGFAIEPNSPDVNVLIALLAKAEGNAEKMNLHLDIVKEAELTEGMKQLVQSIEGE